MGNIVRKLLPHSWGQSSRMTKAAARIEGADALLPASHELEAAVTNYFEALKLPPSPVQVWALVVPRLAKGEKDLGLDAANQLLSMDLSEIRSAWLEATDGTSSQSQTKSTASEAILHLLGRGARLCKVLSGGGGWGKKAGLVSLDPDLEYSTRELRGDSGWDFSFGDDDTGAEIIKQQRAALGEMINEGDSIMFLLGPREDAVADAEETQRETTALKLRSGEESRLMFGVIPSSIDSPSAEDEIDRPWDNVTFHPGVFGMLSEGGMALNIPATAAKSINKSKLDVPSGILTITSGIKKKPPNEPFPHWEVE